MPESESKDPKEEPSAAEELDQNAPSPVTEEDVSPDENAPDERSPAATGRLNHRMIDVGWEMHNVLSSLISQYTLIVLS